MKTLDVSGLHSGIDEIKTKIEHQQEQLKQIETSVMGIVRLSDSLKGEGGTAIRRFYQECHLPFIHYLTGTLAQYEQLLMQMKSSLQALEPASNGRIQESFLEQEVDNGLKQLELVTTALTNQTNATMQKVQDIVYLKPLQDDEVRQYVQKAKQEKDQTLEQLHQFDYEQSVALSSVEADTHVMQSYIKEIQAIFKGGAGLNQGPINLMINHSSHMLLMNKLAQRNMNLPFSSNSYLNNALPLYAEWHQLIQFNYWTNPSCNRLNNYRADSEKATKNPIAKSRDSFKEIGSMAWSGMKERSEKKWGSFTDFGNYISFGLVDGVWSGYKDRYNDMKENPSMASVLNWTSSGITGMVEQSVKPNEAYSAEHWLNSIGLASLLGGGALGQGLRNSATTPPVQKVSSSKKELKTNSVNQTKTSESIQKVITQNGLTVDEFMQLLHPDRVLSSAERRIVDSVREQIGIPSKNTPMAKVIPQRDIYKYVYNEYTGVRGFTAVKEHSSNLRTLKDNYEGARLDYNNSPYKLTNGVDGISSSNGAPDKFYGVIEYRLNDNSKVEIPNWNTSPENYPYTGRGFTGSENVVLPEYFHGTRNFQDGDLMKIKSSNTGDTSTTLIYDGDLNSWIPRK
ncbi:LXG domain-containing protein [Alkalihalophilus pseudofirmus]|uniref:LXG domain-containing protein n=1 Tax=Alkalihalophilus pseudofirmus TaxID=79885 RepID=UPI00259B3045|nr:LXG domain-containing protein [Alkalihalophilus pseudofirmus]WEG18946.1 LXG domain-containing protein [Alkalihalophilus pseudofirmus]